MVCERMRVIETERLRLRPLQTSDAGAISRLAGDWRVARMLADMPYPASTETLRTWVQSKRGEKRYVVEHSGEMIGGVTSYHYPARVAELGYWLGAKWWGQGFAAEAASHLIASEFAEGAIDRFRSGHFLDNPASGKVLAKLGFSPVARQAIWCPARGKRVDALIYELHRQRPFSPGPAEGMTGRATAWLLGALQALLPVYGRPAVHHLNDKAKVNSASHSQEASARP
jgi:RimJ/RimL family protein N-acetyltransferase